MLLCHWHYQDEPDSFKVEILVLTTTLGTAAGGFDVELQYEARAGVFDAKSGTISYRHIQKFPNTAAVQAEVAAGTDPLYLSYVTGSPTAAQLLTNLPGLAAIYDSIALKTATPDTMSAANTPRL